MFAEYPLELVRRAVMPTGIPAECTTFLPTIGIISNWLRNQSRGSDYDRGQQEIVQTRRLLQRMEENDPKTEDEVVRRRSLAQSWLDRADPRARQLSGQKPRGVVTEAERAALLQDARRVGESIRGMKLSDAAKATLGSDP